ncbi:MAG: hypothetical protein HUJ56_01295, partial [Erysipelotrichaceae bacterium]|nr:hypothetical protein [Erysipelotrichaceae bacterium]
MKFKFGVNDSLGAVVVNALIAAIALFVNGLGVYLTIHANIGVAPYDVLHIGISKTFDILYGNASIMVSLSVLIVDILLGESIGIAMIIDAFVVGKAVDFFNWVDIIPVPKTLLGSIVMIFV